MKRWRLAVGAAATVGALAAGGLAPGVFGAAVAASGTDSDTVSIPHGLEDVAPGASTSLTGDFTAAPSASPDFTGAPSPTPDFTTSPSPSPTGPNPTSPAPTPTSPDPEPTTPAPTPDPTSEPTVEPEPDPSEPAMTAYDALVALDERSEDWTGPDVLTTLARVRVDPHGTHAVDTTVATARVVLPADPQGTASVSRGGRDLTVGLPYPATGQAAEEPAVGVVEYRNSEGFSSFPIVRDDASIRLTTVVMEPDAPTDYTFAVGGDASYVMATSDGYALFDDGTGLYTGAVVPTWGFDAEGTPVPTHYESRGGTLTHVIDHSGQDIVYPVVADAHMGEGLINRVDRSTAEGAPRYHVRPSTWGIAVARDFGEGVLDRPLRGSHMMLNEMWDEAVAKGAGDTVSVRQQFDCHAVIAPLKHSWNLESFRPPNDNWYEENSGCNWW